MKRIEAIDSWRAIAILAVMAFHYLVRFAPPAQAEDAYGFDYAYPQLLELGRYGVQVFFVISGMVITMTLLRSRNALDFAFRRFARLYPAFVVCMTFSFAFVALFGPAYFRVGASDYLGNLTLLADRFGFNFVDGAYWSLAVEVEFYAYAAAAWLLLGERFWLGLIGLGLLGAMAARIDQHNADLILLARHMPYFLAGIAAWFVLKEQRRAAGAWLAFTAAALYLAQIDTLTLLGQPSQLCAVAVAVSVATLVVSVATDLSHPALAWIGRISYPLYLIHQNVGVSIIQHLKAFAPDWMAVGAAFGASVLLAWACHRWVEQPTAARLSALWARRALLAQRAPVLARRRDTPAAP
jgi:peptidoglycan/LPS O-acetylase OafA/YrhL